MMIQVIRFDILFELYVLKFKLSCMSYALLLTYYKQNGKKLSFCFCLAQSQILSPRNVTSYKKTLITQNQVRSHTL